MYEEINIEKSIKLLKSKFEKIRKMEYVKSVRRGSTGVGATFEFLLGKEEDSLEIPDFYGIEIKTRRSYSKSLINLFTAVPTGSTFYEVKRLRDKYGYPDIHDKSLKRLNTMVSANKLIKVGVFYNFGLKVDRESNKLILCIYNNNYKLIDESTYWDFDILEKKLLRKMKFLALIKAWPKKLGDIEYFKYYRMDIYRLKGFDAFLKAIDEGFIKVKFTIGNYYDERRYGMVHSHGVSFSIVYEDLEKIFDSYS